MDDALRLGLVTVVLAGDVAVAEMDAVVVEADLREHAIAVEPVGKPLAAELVAARAVAEQRAPEPRRYLAVDLLDPVVVFLVEGAEARGPRIGIGGHPAETITSGADRWHHGIGESFQVGRLGAQPRADGDGVHDGAGHAGAGSGRRLPGQIAGGEG